MAYDFYELLAQARQWAEKALADGRIPKESAKPLFEIDQGDSDALFAVNPNELSSRPLIVAFMGGTGVGKSSLLNRLAVQEIARVGVERPTSKEVTLYHHQSVSLKQLPSGLPLDSVKVRSHHDHHKSHLIWMDMPDFDSIDQDNRHLVLEWLPYIDVLLYVVSPERYRDNKAWQILLAEGAKHAWLFVMNQWDKAVAAQFEDFNTQLLKAGFDNPLMFKTSCVEPADDEFTALLSHLLELSGQHSLVQLKLYNQQLRSNRLKACLVALREELNARNFQQLSSNYIELWEKHVHSLQQGLAWPLQQFSVFMAKHPGQKLDMPIWDDWAKTQFEDALDELVLSASQYNIPAKPLKNQLQIINQRVEKDVQLAAELAAREALLNPGQGWQKFLLKFTAVSEIILPLAAMSFVGYHLFISYDQTPLDLTRHDGVDFAIRSVMLIALSWLLPFFLHKKVQPDLQKSALKGLQKGLSQALSAIDFKLKALLEQEQYNTQLLQQEISALIDACQPAMPGKPEKNSLLQRVLMETER